VRNVFDQYTQPENRLTHALVSAMSEDPRLLRKFVRWVTGITPPKTLEVIEQRLPGELELSEPDYERSGLPDAWIHDDAEWSLLIESKVAASISLEQLKRHYRTAEKRGFIDVSVLAIDVAEPKDKIPHFVTFRTWREIYSWLTDQSSYSDWAARVLQYMEVAESKWSMEGYLKEGTLTEFAGIQFDENNPYNYPEAKRLIRLLMEELRQHPDLEGFIKPKAPGRGAITGKSRPAIWDFLRLKGLNAKVPHTKHPHLSLNIGMDELRAFLLVPNSVESRFRRKLIDLGEDEFFDVIFDVSENMKEVMKQARGASPYMLINQRRFPHRSAKPIVDGTMRFDLRTAFSAKNQAVKLQEEWLSALYALIVNKHSHMEFGVGVAFPYETCRRVKQRAILDSIAASWLACKPLLEVMPKR
jgi:hypothetical protein